MGGAGVATRLSATIDGLRPSAGAAWRGGGGVFALAAMAALAGCFAVGPDYVRPDTTVPSQYKEAKGWKVSTPRDDAPKGEWWRVFHDPELDLLEAQVAVSNQTLKADAANYKEAVALIAEARAGLFPTVNFDPTLTHTGSSSSRFSRFARCRSERELGPRHLGQGAAHDRGRGRRRPGERRHARQRDAGGAIGARHRLHHVARGRHGA